MCLTDHLGAVDVPFTQAEKDAAVNFHNEIRANVTPTASNMQKMVWDDNLAKVAAKWARQCQFGHDKNRSQPELNKYGLPVEQNMGAGHSSLTGAINLWYQELPLWVFGKWTGATGHYIAEIYHASSRIGCGHAKCNDIFGNYWICNYFAGAYSNVDPYEQGASCSKCPNSCDASGKLCDCGGKFCTNGGTLDLNTCKCQCPRLWTGDECEALDCPKKRDFEEYCTYSTFTPETFCPTATVNDAYAKVCPIRCGICPGDQTG
ncbi:hypothetical protein V1264_024953 [Littorina saxatilis]|uniref:SCP domain-containing protein n=2 Tax=Littorina saxatilis TaxID=31220 RepID=A0AAN9AM45_9CAEN